MRGEEAVDDGVGGGVERRQRLYEGRHCNIGGSLWDVSVHLEQVEEDVGRPAQDKHCRRKERGKSDQGRGGWVRGEEGQESVNRKRDEWMGDDDNDEDEEKN